MAAAAAASALDVGAMGQQTAEILAVLEKDEATIRSRLERHYAAWSQALFRWRTLLPESVNCGPRRTN